MTWPLIAAVALAAYVVNLPLVEAARRLATFAGIVDRPNSRSSHAQPVPRGGGLAICISTLGMMAIVGWLVPDVARSYWSSVAIGAALVAAISALDDLKSLPAMIRLVVHVVAAVIAWRAMSGENGATPTAWSFAAAVIGVLWLVGMVNAYNFMDGIDGIAAGTGLVAGLAWLAIGMFEGLPEIAVAGAAVAGACAAFVMFNWSPARIFMGDVGSAFLGYWFGILAVAGWTHQPLVFVQGALLMWPFVFDTSLTMIRRLLRGENPVTPHRTHLYQRLVATGLGHGPVATLYIGLAAIGAAAAGLAGWRPQLLPLWLFIPGASALALWGFVVRQERSRRAATRSAL